MAQNIQIREVRATVSSLSLPLVLAACTGVVGQGDEAPDRADTPGARDQVRCEQNVAPARERAVRLTAVEYRNSVASLFAEVEGFALPELALPPDAAPGTFVSADAQGAQPALVEGYQRHAVKIADRAQAHVDALAPCDGKAEADCAARFIEDFGGRAFRHPLDAAQRQRYQALYEALADKLTYEESIAALVEVMLQSPNFVYQVERSDDGVVDAHALAARLSYFLIDDLPDGELREAADAGELLEPDGFAAQVKRLSASNASHAMAAAFHGQWLKLDELPAVEKSLDAWAGWSDAVAESMHRSAARFVEHVYDSDGTIADLLTSRRAYVDDSLAELYDVQKPGTDEGRLAAVTLDERRRAGLLTQVGWLALEGDEALDAPVRRGYFVLDRLLCAPPPDAPADVDTSVEPPPAGQARTVRQGLEATHNRPACIGCHRSMDAIGFAFGHYDGLGRWRDEDAGLPVDATGEVEVDGGTYRFDDAPALMNALAGDPALARCVATQWVRYAFARAERDADACTIEAMLEVLDKADGALDALPQALASTRAFRLLGSH